MPVTPGAGGGHGVREALVVRPGIDADDAEPRLQRLAVDAHALDGARRGALPRADLGALERRARGRARGEEPALVAEHDLGIRADVHDEGHRVGLVRLLREDHAGRVRPDVAGDAGQHVDPGARMRSHTQFRGGQLDRGVGGQRERRGAEWRRIDAEQEVVHDRVADDRELEDLGSLDPGFVPERRQQAVKGLADRFRELDLAAGMHHHVAHPAHEVLAEADLRVHHAGAREDGAVGQVDEVPGDRRGADVDGDAECAVVEARPDRDHVAATVDRHRDPVRARGQGGLQPADHRQVGGEAVQVPFGAERVEEAPQVPGRGGEIRFRDVHGVQPDDGVHLEGPRREVLAHDLLVDLALGRDVDDGVTEQRRRAGQPAVRRQAVLVPVGRLDLTGDAQMLR